MEYTRRQFLKLGSAALVAAATRRAFGAPVPRESNGLVWIEAEGFGNPGGWAVDGQFMDQMGSPYLLAHGLGKPVADATTTARFPAAGRYRLWVRTRDWVANWKASGAPGKFQVLIDDQLCPVTFGNEGGDWHWQDGGLVDVPADRVTLALRDLTGFEGRCDALVFSGDHDVRLPAGGEDLAQFRKQARGLSVEPSNGGEFELVVVGGGMAGACAALVAARLGVKVAFIQDRPVVGGNNSSEVRVWLGGNIGQKPYNHVGDVVKQLDPKRRAHGGIANSGEIYEDDKKQAVIDAEENITTFMGYRANGVEARGGKVQAVVIEEIRTGKQTRLRGRWFADCTGDGAIGFLAGADYEVQVKGHMGPSNLWNVGDTGKDAPFPRCPWALDLTDKPFPGRKQFTAQWADKGLDALGRWFWECGFDWDSIAEIEQMRDWNLRAMYGAWDALKNVDKICPTHQLHWAAYVAGKRESRRLFGDVILTKDDLINRRAFPDACFPSTWSIDLHYPHPDYRKGFEGREFISMASGGHYPRPYWAPYRCLYSRNVENLFMAGRDISVTHEALGAVRVMRTCGMMGEVVGMAAGICKKQDTNPRGVYERHLSDLVALLQVGVGKLPTAG